MKSKRPGFTLIELLVVVAIIALLIAILLPSLGKARSLARAVKCGAQMRAVGQACAGYLADNQAYYPASYFYPKADGTLNPFDQGTPDTTGYAHWSYFLFNYSKDVKAFTCPEFELTGVPRTNPGKTPGYWGSGQVDRQGNSVPASANVEDKQAPFMAFTANAAIMPRNKFYTGVSDLSGTRLNQFVKQTMLSSEGRTILATEFNNNWRTITSQDSNGLGTRSHRPVNPFVSPGGGTNEYAGSDHDFFLPTNITDLYDSTELAAQVNAGQSLIEDPRTQLNAVGRHHPGSYSKNGKSYGGTANFLYVDGHVERKSVGQTVVTGVGSAGWEWGESYWTIKGTNYARFN